VNASLIAADVVAFSAQVACVVAVAAIASLLVRIDAASVRYQYWRAVLMLCLMLPWLQGRQPTGAAGESIGTAVLSVTAISATTTPAASMATDRLPWYALSVWIIVGVIGLRVARLGLGLFRLRRLRRSGRPAGPNAEHDDLQRALGTRAEIRYVPGEQPVTCGMWRPVVLLPETLPSHPPAIQRAVLTHELLHVQRRDWLWLTSEEMLRAVLWFHPAIWWLVGRVRLAREEVVDELTVLSTGQRRAYLEALLAFADAAPVVPAAAFARRHHLFRRITLISKEAVMSSKRIVVSAVVLAAAVIAGTWYSVNAFPMLQAPGTIRAVPQAAVTTDAEPGPLERTAKPITPENPIPRRTYAVSPKSPVADIDSGAVLVTLRLTLNGLGRIAEVRLVGRGTARMGWSTAPDGRGRGAMVAGVVGGLAPAPEAFVTAAAEAVRQWIYDPPADAPIAFDVTFEFSTGAGARLVAHGGPAAVRFMPAPPPPPLPPAPGTTTALNWAPGAVRVGGNILPPTKVKDVAPVYPPIAQTARVQGVVILESLIGADGRVQDARILRSIPLLDQAALDAVKQWEFTPTMLNGQPAPVIMTITVQFTLTQ
jgi:TonB family protein